MRRCYRCKTEWTEDKPRPGFKETCPACNAYLHCCKNCRLHDPKAHNGCISSTTEWVGDPSRANFCGEFEFAQTASMTKSGEKPSAAAALDELFGGKLPDEGGGPKDFKSLFGD